MTTFCVMEQGKSINDPITIEKRELFDTPFSDFYRLNWFCDDDPNAAFSAPGVCWSEGRSLLYEKVPKQYDYYVFIDDDIVFDAPDGAHVPTLMRDFFDEYKPLAGSFYCPDSWSHRPHPRPSLARRIGARLVGKRAGIPSQPFDRAPHPMYSYDLELQFYSASFADAVLPVPFHGSDRTMHYTHFICATQYPLKQLCLSRSATRDPTPTASITQTRLAPTSSPGFPMIRYARTLTASLICLMLVCTTTRMIRTALGISAPARSRTAGCRASLQTRQRSTTRLRISERYTTSNLMPGKSDQPPSKRWSERCN